MALLIYPISFSLKVENKNDGLFPPTAHESFQMSVCLSVWPRPFQDFTKKETSGVVLRQKKKRHPRQTGASINIQMLRSFMVGSLTVRRLYATTAIKVTGRDIQKKIFFSPLASRGKTRQERHCTSQCVKSTQCPGLASVTYIEERRACLD
jgi:hypothetical protein